jgi:hypothetical protein
MHPSDRPSPIQPNDLVVALEALARRAGTAILNVKRNGIQAHAKSDGSPVTEADLAANSVILDDLSSLLPDVPVITEESEDGAKVLADPEGDFLLIDPLDGTREFVSGDPDYTVNIAYVRARRPVIGIVHMPETGLSWVGDSRLEPRMAWQIDKVGVWQPITTRAAGAVPSGPCHRGFLKNAPSFRTGSTGLILEVLPDRCRAGRSLSAVWANHGMGHRSRRRGLNRSRWRGIGPTGPSLSLWEDQRRMPQLRLYGDG